MNEVRSPLTGGKCEHLESIDKKIINNLYRSSYDIDVSHYFNNIHCIEKYICLDTGLEFFYPIDIAGTEELYEKLQKFDWFYKESKWEYKQSLRFVSAETNVLDVGCGYGHFLQACMDKGANTVGLEFNEKACIHAKSKKHTVYQQSIEEHSIEAKSFYDVVCTFQVLEHVVDINSFISSCLAVLKSGGFFVVGVPNNDAFIRHDTVNALNLPPHHMSHWGRDSLESLPKYFDCEFHSIDIEPLAETDWFQQVMERRYISNRFVKSIYYRLGFASVFKKFIKDNAKTIAGHTILAIYQKK